MRDIVLIVARDEAAAKARFVRAPHSALAYIEKAGRYTLLEQEALAPLLDVCAQTQTRIVIGGVFNSGVLAGNGKFNYCDAPAEVVAKVRALADVCQRFDVSFPAAGLQFVFAHPSVVSCVVGVRSVQQLTQSIAWLETTIPAHFWSTLHAEGLVSPDTPTPEEAQ